MKKRSMLLLLALVITIVYLALQGANYSDSMNKLSTTANTAEEAGTQLGTAIGMTILLPHMILVMLGAIFNAVAWIGKQRWAALTAAILYTVGGVLGLTNFLFMILPMVFCYVAYCRSRP